MEMFLLKNLFYILCFLFASIKKTKSTNDILNITNFYSLYDPEYCFREGYVYFNNELYKICAYAQKVEGKNEFHLNIKKMNEALTKKIELFKEEYKNLDFNFFVYSTNGKLIILLCSNKYKGKDIKCYRLSSTTGVIFITERINIPNEPFVGKKLYSYTAAPLEIFNKKYLLICGIYTGIEPISKNSFIRCISSDDDGFSWRKTFDFYYKDVPNYSSAMLLELKTYKKELGFIFHMNIPISGKKYIKCTYRNNYNFDCVDVYKTTKDKQLQDIIKIGEYHIIAYADNDKKRCYLYYSNDNSMLYAPKGGNIPELTGCFRVRLTKLDDKTFFFKYKNGDYHYVYTLHNMEDTDQLYDL